MQIPNSCKDKDLKNLIVMLLQKNPDKRNVNEEVVLGHNYFRSINIDELLGMNLPPPYLPKIKVESSEKSISYVNYLIVSFYSLLI